MPDSKFKLFSSPKRLKCDFEMAGDEDAIKLAKEDLEVIFGVKITTRQWSDLRHVV